MTVYSRLMVAVSSDHRVRDLVTRWPTTQGLVERFVAGEHPGDALAVVAELAGDKILATVDRLGESVSGRAEARANTEAYRYLLGLAAQQGQAAGLDVSVKLSALGLTLPADGHQVAFDNVAAVCERAAALGATVTLDMEGYTTTEATLVAHERLRRDFPTVAVAVQAALRRSESDCRALASSGARVRLCKGAYLVPSMVGFGDSGAVRASYARCLGILMAGTAYPMVATHDPELLGLASRLATQLGRQPSPVEVPAGRTAQPANSVTVATATAAVRSPSVAGATGTVATETVATETAATETAPRHPVTGLAVQTGPGRSFEYQMLFGVRPAEQRRLVAGGAKVRVYVPYGPSWYPYLTRRLAERPANLVLFLRAAADRHQ